jgi:hypothetical protein
VFKKPKDPRGNAPTVGLSLSKLKKFETTVTLKGNQIGVLQNMLIYVHENDLLLADLIRSTDPESVVETFKAITNVVGEMMTFAGEDVDKMAKTHTAINGKGQIIKKGEY